MKSNWAWLIVGLGLCITTQSWATQLVCQGPFNGQKLSQTQLNRVIKTHLVGKPLNFCGADLNGIWITWQSGRLKHWQSHQELPNKPTLVTKLLTRHLAHPIRVSFYFSLLSAFQIGFREFNIANWITHLQTRHYQLNAKGWVRIIAGTQSLISVYLIVLWALTYFGRPFKW